MQESDKLVCKTKSCGADSPCTFINNPNHKYGHPRVCPYGYGNVTISNECDEVTRFKIAISDSYCEWTYDMSVCADASIDDIINAITSKFVGSRVHSSMLTKNHTETGNDHV